MTKQSTLQAVLYQHLSRQRQGVVSLPDEATTMQGKSATCPARCAVERTVLPQSAATGASFSWLLPRPSPLR
ncbi:MAG: hypothetical protein ABI947_19335 [Chloroflexota bacterium]